MLTSVGRAAARRVQTSRISAPTSVSAQLIGRQNAVAAALPIRSFTASTWSSSPTASDKKPAKKTTTTTTKKAAGTTTTTKSKAKATETKSKDKATKAKAKPKPKAVEEKPKKPKKEVDPEKLKKLEIKELKKWTLKDKLPTLPASSWILFISENRGSSLGVPVAGILACQTLHYYMVFHEDFTKLRVERGLQLATFLTLWMWRQNNQTYINYAVLQSTAAKTLPR